MIQSAVSLSVQVDTLLAQIAPHLPVLEQRVRRRELSAVIRDALAQGDRSPLGFLRLAAEYERQSLARRARLESLRSAYFAASTAAARTLVIARALAEEQAPKRTLAALHRGWLDLDAMAERAEVDLHELAVRHSLALRAAAALASGQAARPVTESLLDYLLTRPAPLSAVAAAEALTELLARAPEGLQAPTPPVERWEEGTAQDERWERVCALLGESAIPRRVLAALARLCLQAVPYSSLKYLAIRLGRAEAGDDFLIRQHFVVLLGKHAGEAGAFELLAAKAQRGDTSEHVRLALPEALRSTGGAAAVPLLQGLAGAGPEGRVRDQSPRVRAAAAIALAGLLRMREADTTAELIRLMSDPDPLVYKITAQEIEALAGQSQLTESAAAALAEACRHQAAQAATTARAEPALRALEALATITNRPLAIAHDLLAQRLADLPQGAAVRLPVPIEPLTFGRLLAQLARDGLGFYAQPVAGGYQVERGARLVRRAWRLLHELRWRSPYKRQDGRHTIGRQFFGTLRAHSGMLAEATSTAVPGEPLASPSDGTWGPHLPTVDDLLSMPIWKSAPVLLFSTRGLVRIEPPPTSTARLRAWLHLNSHYAALADLRLRALDPADPSESTRFIEAVEALGFTLTLQPYPAEGSAALALLPSVAAPFGQRALAGHLAPSALTLLLSPQGLGEMIHYFMSPADNTLEQLGVAAAITSAVMLAGNIVKRTQIRTDRAAIPLCIGGWGTRGKSGTERLKAALMHALDIDVLVKTTGCEAMFIHGVPGRKPTEIFIHRSYDKATIWEQRDLLSLAARLGVSVFLWECMALSAPLVRVLSEEWMHDDVQTLTNAYPDHEDIQGPAGHDVARSIAGFIRPGGVTITTEEQMLPILEQEARRKRARLIVVTEREHLLLGEDLLARFPYQEHPRNIALVRRLAVGLGRDADLATADMADYVVPDLGVLKAYPEMRHRGRRLTFVNGMSANERTGFLSNWQRTGCERPADQPGRWVITVVNNRFDRVARSKVFAEVLVRDASAERHVLIGTNLSGLRVYLEESLTHLLQELGLFRANDEEAQLRETLKARCQRLHHRLRIGKAEPEAVLLELQAWLGGGEVSTLAAAVKEALAAAARWADEQEALTAIIAKLRELPLNQQLTARLTPAGRPPTDAEADELTYHACRSIARRALLASLERAGERALTEPAERPGVTERQDRLYRELFRELVIVVEDSGASGDQVIDTIVRACPPGIAATVMGIQNIKGTGLDFVYRFIRYDEVNTLVNRLSKADGTEARSITAELVERTDFGMLDSALAAQAVAAAAGRFAADAGLAQYLQATAARLTEIAQRCQAALTAGQKQQKRTFARVIERLLDTVDAARRRWYSEAILDALVHREISHERAALQARHLVDREKKGWLRK